MTCLRFENELALYVERDLPEADVPAVEAHLLECPTCPSFLADLRASQAQVKDLASEDMAPEALVAVRVRFLAAAAAPRRGHEARMPAFAVAAATVLALGALVWVVALARWTGPARIAVASPRPMTGPTIPAPVTASPSGGSTPPGPASVSPRMERGHVRRGRADRPSVAPALSPDDADQLARAVVAIARVERVDEVPADAEPSPAPAPLMRLATADPDIVIYWQLEPNGGE
jgi:hypothetical protein